MSDESVSEPRPDENETPLLGDENVSEQTPEGDEGEPPTGWTVLGSDGQTVESGPVTDLTAVAETGGEAQE